MQIKKVLLNFDLIVAVSALAGLWGTIMLQVILRSIFNAPLMGADEMTPYLVIWVILAPLAYTERTIGHIIMEEFQVILPSIIKKIIRFLVSVSTTGIYVLVSFSVIYVIKNNLYNTTATLRMPFYIFFIPSAIGFFGISILRITSHIYTMLKKELPWASQ